MIDYLKLRYFQEIAIIFVSKTRISVLYLNIICPLVAVDLLWMVLSDDVHYCDLHLY